jgi:hypothetical protein
MRGWVIRAEAVTTGKGVICDLEDFAIALDESVNPGYERASTA